jgi:hypothetical protein
MMAVNPGIEVFLLDPEGNILSYVVLDSKVKLKRVDLDPVKKFNKLPRGKPRGILLIKNCFPSHLSNF